VIRIDVGATGVDAVKGVAAGSMQDPSAPADTAYGAMVAPHLVAVNHDHFMSFRLDVDIDGAANTLMRQRLAMRQPAMQQPEGGAGRRGLWALDEEPVTAEGPLGTEHDATQGGAEIWRIVNPNLTGSLGLHSGYELRPDHTATSLLPPGDFPQRRAAFSA